MHFRSGATPNGIRRTFCWASWRPNHQARADRTLRTGKNPLPEGPLSGPRERGFAQTPPLRGPADRKPVRRHRNLLQLDLGAGCFQLCLDLLGVRLGHCLLDRLRRTLDQVLGFLEAKTGDGPDFLDDVDLLGASVGQDDVELGLLLGRGSSSAARSTACGSNRHRRGGGDAPLLLEHLRQLSRLEDGQARQVFYDLGEISHFYFPSNGSNVLLM